MYIIKYTKNKNLNDEMNYEINNILQMLLDFLQSTPPPHFNSKVKKYVNEGKMSKIPSIFWKKLF